ncbi:extensin family protein [Shimia haliotis]|uniref:Extensin-like protein C-terminus n=1 Tax=Shimia haliotis TaxID=1280847 RepID=A0A1I4H6C3_9RHOB|nr:extensin family protein [Shimia haliotis]SFL37838.1 Extensin-like protein C-terminus [Shimia haliotis]
MTLRGGILTAFAVGALLAGDLATANAPEKSLRPVLRGDVFPQALPSLAPDQSLRPRVRPGWIDRAWNKTRREADPLAAAPQVAAAAVVPTSAKPARVLLPKNTSKATPASLPTGRDAVENGVTTTQRLRRSRLPDGMAYLCSSKVIIGKTHAPVAAALPGCGIPKGAIKLYQVADVKLSTPAVMTCETALALHRWVDNGAKEAVKNYGGGVSKLKVAAGYACRTRNNRPGAKISEHGRGKAIDISAIYTKSGEPISVLSDWGKGKKGRMLKKMHRAACGPFGTVLGPNADRYHKDHFHFDVANHRSGPYCR